MRTRFGYALVLSLIACGACHEPEPSSPSVGLTQPVDPPQPPDLGNYSDRDITVHVFLTDNLRHYCVGPDPFFHYDSDKVTSQDQPGLYALAACMTTGPLKDKRVQLTGRADPRGGVAFNDKLGLERAERVKKFLVDHGVSTDRLVTASAGKLDSDPSPGKWRTDRRVDIDVVP